MLPPWQLWCGLTAWMQPPQFSGLLVTSTQELPHSVRFPVQPTTHVVPLQSAFGFWQVTPHWPQLVALDLDASQASPDAPQIMLGPHATLQDWHVVTLESEASQPLLGFMSQSAKPGAQAQP